MWKKNKPVGENLQREVWIPSCHIQFSCEKGKKNSKEEKKQKKTETEEYSMAVNLIEEDKEEEEDTEVVEVLSLTYKLEIKTLTFISFQLFVFNMPFTLHFKIIYQFNNEHWY